MSLPRFQHVAITARSEIEGKESLLDRIVRAVEGTGAHVCIDPERCDVPLLRRCERFRELAGVDLVIILGGDGTILRTVRELKDFSIPLLTVNQGRVGFLAELDAKDIERDLPQLLAGEGVVEDRQILSCTVLRGDEEISSGLVLNEVVVSQGAIARLIELSTKVSGQPLTTFRADGIIVSTPTGSTAYSLAAGGPIVHPELCAIILTPINPYAFGQKPIVIPATEVVEIEVLGHHDKFADVQVSLTFDGQVHHLLRHGDRIVVRDHPDRARFLRRRTDAFYERLRGRLQWGQSP